MCVCVRAWFHPFAPRLEKNPSFPLSGTKDSRNRVTQCWEEINFRPQNVWFRHSLNAPPFVFCLNSTLMSWSSGITYCFTLFNWQTSCHHDMHVRRCLCSALYFLAAMEWGRQGWRQIPCSCLSSDIQPRPVRGNWDFSLCCVDPSWRCDFGVRSLQVTYWRAGWPAFFARQKLIRSLWLNSLVYLWMFLAYGRGMCICVVALLVGRLASFHQGKLKKIGLFHTKLTC